MASGASPAASLTSADPTVSPATTTNFSTSNIPTSNIPTSVSEKTIRVGPDQAPYLKNIPQLTDREAVLSRSKNLTEAQQSHLERRVTQICQQIREAREIWQRDHSDEILWD